MNISFGKKIPIATGNIQNRKTGEFERATVYELDCRDESDFQEVLLSRKDWNFNWEIYDNMQHKYNVLAHRIKMNPDFFYILQTKDNETVAMAEISKWENNLFSIDWLDTKINNPYKFVGQTFLACLAKESLANGGSAFAVLESMEDAIPFYTDVCKFTDCGKSGFHMDKEQMREFISRTEERTQASIIDLKV
ncbi:MAG: hypothetical protein IJY61_04725 [Candidatus Gastranaerophilales bacterium]|nr:hypothetical protein [Candidatus Gastranaerophilales bacterium]